MSTSSACLSTSRVWMAALAAATDDVTLGGLLATASASLSADTGSGSGRVPAMTLRPPSPETALLSSGCLRASSRSFSATPTSSLATASRCPGAGAIASLPCARVDRGQSATGPAPCTAPACPPGGGEERFSAPDASEPPERPRRAVRYRHMLRAQQRSEPRHGRLQAQRAEDAAASFELQWILLGEAGDDGVGDARAVQR